MVAFDDIAGAFLAEGGVTEGTGFGKVRGLRVNGKIFAMLMDELLVVKLPRERCEALVAGEGAAYLRMGQREMRQWISVAGGDWPALAREAMEFVREG